MTTVGPLSSSYGGGAAAEEASDVVGCDIDRPRRFVYRTGTAVPRRSRASATTAVPPWAEERPFLIVSVGGFGPPIHLAAQLSGEDGRRIVPAGLDVCSRPFENGMYVLTYLQLLEINREKSENIPDLAFLKPQCLV